MKLPIVPLTAALLLLAGANPAAAIQKGTQEKPEKEDLKPGEYVWEPKAADKGSVDIIVDLAAQKLAVYRDGVEIGRSTISSGRQGYETPPGIYMIVQKEVTHHSNKYHEASMPFMERLTWSGLAIHAGNTPGHPESHGCMHVPEEFAKKLYGVTEEGTTVMVAGNNVKPEPTSDPDLLFAAAPDTAPTASPVPAPGGTPEFTWKPEEVPTGPISIVFTSADKHVYVYRKGVQIGRADLGGPEAGHPFGNHVYAALADTQPGGAHSWNLLGSGEGSAAPNLKDLARGLELPAEFREKLRGIIAPGTTLVITDRAANPTKAENKESED